MSPPEKLIIETPELTSLEYSLAGIGSRFMALAIDTAIQVGAGALLGAPLLALRLADLLGTDATNWAVAAYSFVMFCVWYGYFAGFEAVWNGQTPGKRRVRLRVIKDSGRPIGVFDAIARNLIRIVDQFPLFYAVGTVSVLVSAQSKRLGDYVAGTVVVHERPDQADEPHWESGEAAGHPSRGALRTERLSREAIDLVEAFLARRSQLAEQIRRETAEQIVDRIAGAAGVAPEARRDPERVLEAVAREGRRRR